VKARVKSAGANLGLKVGGTPQSPAPDSSSALLAVAGRFGGIFGNTAGNLASGGLQVGKTALNTVGTIGAGAGKTVASVGKGLFQTVKGVATADLGKIGEGVKTATVGTVTEAAETVADTAEGVGKGVVDTGAAAVGMESAEDWRNGTEARWHAEWNKALALLATMPFPRPAHADSAPAAPETTNDVVLQAPNPVEGETPEGELPVPAPQSDDSQDGITNRTTVDGD